MYMEFRSAHYVITNSTSTSSPPPATVRTSLWRPYVHAASATVRPARRRLLVFPLGWSSRCHVVCQKGSFCDFSLQFLINIYFDWIVLEFRGKVGHISGPRMPHRRLVEEEETYSSILIFLTFILNFSYF